MPAELETYVFLLNEGVCPAGTFSLDPASGRMEWSEGLFRIHGFVPGAVVPTLELLLAHKHPKDRDSIRKLVTGLLETGGQGAVFHRLIDSKSRERKVFSAIQANRSGSGPVTRLQGFMIDLTSALARDSHQAVDDAIHAVYGTREVIEQAKGIIMAVSGVGPEEAFLVLSEQSQNTNTKVSVVAAALVSAAANGTLRQTLSQWTSRAIPQ